MTERRVDARALRELPLFAGSTPAELIAAAPLFDSSTVGSGTRIITEQRRPPGLVVVLHGQLSVDRRRAHGKQRLAVLERSAYVGELGLLEGGPAGADVTAATPVGALLCEPGSFDELVGLEGPGGHIRATAARRLGANWSRAARGVRVTLPGGIELALRPLRPDDADRLRDLGTRLSAASRRMRFFTNSLPSGSKLEALLDVDHLRHCAIVAESADDSGRAVLGVARAVGLPDRAATAEVAMVVADEMHGRGIGSLLLDAITSVAAAHRFETLTASVLHENDAMLRLLEKVDATVVGEDAGALSLRYTPSARGGLLTPDEVSELVRPAASWETELPRAS